MPVPRLDLQALREALRDPAIVERDSFAILHALCASAGDELAESDLRELVLRLMEFRDRLKPYQAILDALIRHVGLFPYLDQELLGDRDWLAYEAHKPDNMESEIVLHRSQARIYHQLKQGANVALSAPTSFGKSLLIDALLATGRYNNIVIVLPTVALIDETRRRLTRRFAHTYKIITHPSQSMHAKNVFVLTQERVMEFSEFPTLDLFVVDEFYKLSPGRDDDDRCAMLNSALYRLLKISRQFYMLGPFILGLADGFKDRFECHFFKEDFHTVVSELHRVNSADDGATSEMETVVELCRSLDEPTIVFCASPSRAAKVAIALTEANLGIDANGVLDAAKWIADHYHADWHFGKALASGIGVHHGRIPRALGQLVVRHFNAGNLRLLVCTSTLIEGVNTRAKNIVVLDHKINRENIDLFTFNNIRGRAGRMRQHFVGHVYVFHAPPQMGLPFVDVPAFSQNENAPDSLLMQIDDEDLSRDSMRRLAPFRAQQELPFETLKENVGVDPSAQIEMSRLISRLSPSDTRLLSWHGLPRYAELELVCGLIWEAFDGRRLGSGSIRSPAQLTLFINRLRSSPKATEMIHQAMSRSDNADEAVQQINDFLRLWAQFHFPRLLRATDRIQRVILPRMGAKPGNYEFFAGKVECLFLDPALIALDEYGVPIEVARKLTSIRRNGDIDATLQALRDFDVRTEDLDEFERDVIRDAQANL